MLNFLKNKYQMRNAIIQYGKYYYDSKYELRKLIWYYKNKKSKKIAIWGAGLKGAAFLKVIDSDGSRIDCAIDINSNHQGRNMPTGHQIVNFKEIKDRKIEIVFIMNANHFAEIYMLLKKEGIHIILIDLDKSMGAKMTTRESVESRIVV